jgi:hypothetical protein
MEPQERVATQAALLGGLEQKAGPVASELEQRRDRGLAVIDEAQPHRDHVGVDRKAPGAIEVGLQPQRRISDDGH